MINLDTYSTHYEAYLTFYTMHARSLIKARDLFPDRPPHYWRASKQLAEYAKHKALAIRCRSNGQIMDARFHEMKCRQIYKMLPDYAKWEKP